MFYNFKGGWGGGVPLYHSYRIHPLLNLNFLDPTLNFISFIKRDLMAHGICVSFNIKKMIKSTLHCLYTS